MLDLSWFSPTTKIAGGFSGESDLLDYELEFELVFELELELRFRAEGTISLNESCSAGYGGFAKPFSEELLRAFGTFSSICASGLFTYSYLELKELTRRRGYCTVEKVFSSSLITGILERF